MDEQGEGLLAEEAAFVIGGVEVNPARQGYTAVHNYAQYFWRPYLGNGALDVLRRERLVQVMCQGEGQMSSYTFRVLKTLPVLRPDQVARLSARLQHDHRVWLQRRGIDPATYREAFARPAQYAGSSTDPAHHAGSSTDRVEPSARPLGAECPCAPALTPPGATGTSPSAPRTAGDAPRTTGAAPDSTNHPQEASLANHWWQEALTELQPQLMRSTFELCLLRSKAQSFRDGVFTVRTAGPLARDFMQHRLLPLIQRTLHSTSGGQVRGIVFE